MSVSTCVFTLYELTHALSPYNTQHVFKKCCNFEQIYIEREDLNKSIYVIPTKFIYSTKVNVLHLQINFTSLLSATSSDWMEFYKSFWSELQEDLLFVLNDSRNKGQLPRTCPGAVITLLPEKGNPYHCCVMNMNFI